MTDFKTNIGINPIEFKGNGEEEREKAGIIPLFFCKKEKVNDGIEVFDFCERNDVEEVIGEENVKQAEKKVRLFGVHEKKNLQFFNENVGGVDCGEFSDSLIIKSPGTNFALFIRLRRNFINRKGNQEYEKNEILFSVIVNNEVYDLVIKTKDLPSLCKYITKKIPTAIINFEIQNVEKMLENQFRSTLNICPKNYIYYEAGWQIIDGKHIYVRDSLNLGGGKATETGLTLPEYRWNSQMVLDIFQRACQIYQDENCNLTMVVFSLMGVLHRLFKEVGYTPRFTLFLYGKTGSLKTAIAKIFFTQLCRDEFRDIPRRFDTDTRVSLERGIVGSGYDTITIIDDFCPSRTERKRNEKEDKLEMVVRMIGDGSSRSRSNLDLEDCRGEGVHGMVALTGELTGKGVSSNLRCLYCKMERERVNLPMVTWFQENPYMYTTFIAAFVDFVGENYDSLKNMIKTAFKIERKNVEKKIRERRIVDMSSTLCIAADILKFFLLHIGMSIDAVNEIIGRMRKATILSSQISQELSLEESPAITYVQAIAALMSGGGVKLHTEKLTRKNIAEYDGFLDATFLYFNPERIHRKVILFLRQGNHYFPYELREIISMLAEENIIKTASNGFGKRTFYTRISLGDRMRYNFLKIRRSVFDAIVEGTFDSDYGER